MAENKSEVSAPTQSFPLIEKAIDKGLDVEQLKGLLELQMTILKREAASEFAAEMARFQRDRPEIIKDAVLPHVTRAGSNRPQKYAKLDNIRRTIRPHLGALYFRWDTEYPDERTLIETCTVTHPLGHSETAKYKCPITGTKAMSDQQMVKSAISYGMRVSLIQVLGLTECDEDDDGSGGSVETVTEAQATELEAMCSDVGGDKAMFLKLLKVERFVDIPAASYVLAKRDLQRKGAAK